MRSIPSLSPLWRSETPFVPAVGEWIDHAACADLGIALFFPSPGPRRGRKARERAAAVEAKAVCARCPVRVECLEYALAAESGIRRFGVFGGMTPAERNAMAASR